MAFSFGRNIVTRGLSLLVDAANVKSYPGTGIAWNDLSGSGNHGILLNGPTYNSEGSLTFDGTDDVSEFSSLPGSFASFSIMVWFYPTSVVDFKNVMDCNYLVHSSGNVGPRLEMSTAGALAWAYSNQTANISALYTQNVVNSGLQANVWHNAAITYNGGTNTSTTYYNGVSTGIARITAGAPTGFVGTMGKVAIGRGFQAIAGRILTGRVSIVSIHNVELTAAEVKQNFDATRSRYGK